MQKQFLLKIGDFIGDKIWRQEGTETHYPQIAWKVNQKKKKKSHFTE